MTSVNLEIVNSGYSASERLDGDGKSDFPIILERITFTIRPLGFFESIELSSGTIFKRTQNGVGNEQSPEIPEASLTLYRGLEPDGQSTRIMSYHEAISGIDYSAPETISFRYQMSEDLFDRLLCALQSGCGPQKVQVEFPFDLRQKSALTYGWRPDGSIKKWNITEQEDRHQDIKAIEFLTDYEKFPCAEEISSKKTSQHKFAKGNNEDIQRTLKYISIGVLLIVGLLAFGLR